MSNMFERYDQDALQLMGIANHIAQKTNCSYLDTVHLWLAKFFSSKSINKRIYRRAMQISDHIRVPDNERPFTPALKEVLLQASLNDGAITRDMILFQCEDSLKQNDSPFLAFTDPTEQNHSLKRPYHLIIFCLILLLSNHALGSIVSSNGVSIIDGAYTSVERLSLNQIQQARKQLIAAGFTESIKPNGQGGDYRRYDWKYSGLFADESVSISIHIEPAANNERPTRETAVLIGNLTTTISSKSDSFWLPIWLWYPSQRFSHAYDIAREVMAHEPP